MNPYEILGIEKNADDQAVRKAYFELLKLHSPDRDPIGFKKIRKAYELVKDENSRIVLRMYWKEPPRALGEILNDIKDERNPGEEIWFQLIAAAKGDKS